MNAKTEEKETIEEQFIASSCAFSCGIRASCRVPPACFPARLLCFLVFCLVA